AVKVAQESVSRLRGVSPYSNFDEPRSKLLGCLEANSQSAVGLKLRHPAISRVRNDGILSISSNTFSDNPSIFRSSRHSNSRKSRKCSYDLEKAFSHSRGHRRWKVARETFLKLGRLSH